MKGQLCSVSANWNVWIGVESGGAAAARLGVLLKCARRSGFYVRESLRVLVDQRRWPYVKGFSPVTRIFSRVTPKDPCGETTSALSHRRRWSGGRLPDAGPMLDQLPNTCGSRSPWTVAVEARPVLVTPADELPSPGRVIVLCSSQCDSLT